MAMSGLSDTKLILELSRLECELDLSGSLLRISEVTTVTTTAMRSIRDSKKNTQIIFPEFE